MRSLLQIPYGVQCFYGREARLRRAIESRVAGVFAGWSYEEIIPPLFDYDEVFTRGGGAAAKDSVYRFVGRDGEVLALRPDFTALVAKVVASRMPERPMPLRLFYTGEVLRYQPPRAGRQEDLFQIGLEHIGNGVHADLEVLLVAFEALDSVGVGNAVVTLGDAGFMLGLLEEMRIGVDNRTEIMAATRARDRNRLRTLLGQEPPRVLLDSMQLIGDRQVLVRAEGMPIPSTSRNALGRLVRLAEELERLGLNNRIQFDLGEVLGFDYYTGMVFEIHAEGSGLALGGGGRYDSLLSRFGCARPAVGFSLSLDRLASQVAEKSTDLAKRKPPQVVAKTQDPHRTFSEALEFRRRGWRVEVG
jgi:ATP phosphoribosyltransferase regulatory subunit